MAILDGLIYPPVGFHFSVVFELFPQTPQDFRFQSVSGLSTDIQTESIAEGGENRFKHQFPGVPQYSKITLKRGLFIGSFISEWCRNSIENFDFKPCNIMITLLNSEHVPLNAWHVINAYPVKWSVSEFNAEQNTVVVESIELAYQYYRTINLLSAVTGAVSVNVSL